MIVSYKSQSTPVKGYCSTTRVRSAAGRSSPARWRALSRIALGMQECLYIGNLSSRRDWGHAREYVRAMYLINQQDEPDDYVIATGVTTSIRDFIRMSAGEIGLEISFRGEGSEETGTLTAVDEKVYAEMMALDVKLMRRDDHLRSGGYRVMNYFE